MSIIEEVIGRTNQISFIEEVVKRTNHIEQLIEKKFGGNGCDVWEKVISIGDQLPERTVEKIKYIATVRNQLEDEKSDALRGSQEQFIADCDECISVLESTEPITTPNFPNPFNDLTDNFAQIEYNDAKSQKKEWKNPLKNLNFSGQPKWLKTAVYIVGLIIICNILIQALVISLKLFGPKPAEQTAAAPIAAKPDAPKPVDVPAKKIDNYAGTYEMTTCTFDFYSTSKQFFIKEGDGCGNRIFELTAISETSFRFVKESPYSEFNGTVDFISKNGKTSGLQITSSGGRKFYKKIK